MKPGFGPLRVSINTLAFTELSKFIDWPETGLEEINSDVLEAETRFYREWLCGAG